MNRQVRKERKDSYEILAALACFAVHKGIDNEQNY